MSKTKTYFASDFHLGVPRHAESLKREKKITSWLDEIKEDETKANEQEDSEATNS